jgi:predicted metal-dependent HD superfamily phosphohydrolase
MNLKRRWLSFCRRAGARPGAEAGAPGQAFADLDRRYREPGRHYHTWRHVAACLRELRRAGPGPAEAQALELALWIHDAVYRPGRSDNEQASSELAQRWASALGLAPALGPRAAALILATRHEPSGAVPADPAAALLLDIDLAVLGAPWSRYLRYERGIAREYSAMPPAAFREGRARLLRGFLERPALYATPSYRKLERQARANLARALQRLERAYR